MSFLDNIGGMLPGAYAGFQHGYATEANRQRTEADDQFQTEQRARVRANAPLEDEAMTSRLRTQIEADKRAGELAPLEHENNVAVATDKAETIKYEAANNQVRRAVGTAANRKDGLDKLTLIGGEAIAKGDNYTVDSVIKNLHAAGFLSEIEGFGEPAKAELAQAPEGAVDLKGRPVKGRAIQVTMADGTQTWVGSDYMLAAYQKAQIDADTATAKAIKPGEKLVTRKGRVIAEGNERAYGGGLVQDEDGNWVRIPGLGGTGTGKGGKAPKTPQSTAVEFFMTSAEKAETKLTPNQLAYGQRVAEQIASTPGVPPAVAAEVAVEVATDPTKIQPKVNVQTGKVEGVFSRRDLGDIVVEPWTPAYQNSVTPEQMTKAAQEFVKAQPAALQEQLVAAAHDPAARAKLEENLKTEIAKTYPGEQGAVVMQTSLATLGEKLDMLGKNLPAPKKDSPSLSDRISAIGGLTRSSRPAPTVDPTSPAGKVQARRAAASEARKAADEKEAAARVELSAQFQKDKATLEPLELARKYDDLRMQLPTADAAELQRIERTIR